MRRRRSACQEIDPPPTINNSLFVPCKEMWRGNIQDAWIPMEESHCHTNKDETNSLGAEGRGRPFDMVKDDVLLAWQQSPHKDTLGFYGVGSPSQQPESVAFNQVLSDCLAKVSSGVTQLRRPKKEPPPSPRITPAGNIMNPEICKPFILNRQALQTEMELMPNVKLQLDPRKAYESIYCNDPPDPHDPLGVNRQLEGEMDPKPKKEPHGLRRRHWYCPMDCGQAGNACTQYEWAKYKMDPRPYNKEFREWLQGQKEQQSPEPKDYNELYERFLKCFEPKPLPDPLCRTYNECCKPKKPKENEAQGGGDGHGGFGDGHRPGRPYPNKGKPTGVDKTGTGNGKEDRGSGEGGEGADGTGDDKDKGDDKNKDGGVDKERDKNKDKTKDKDKDKDTTKDQNKDTDQTKDKNKYTDKTKDKNKDKNTIGKYKGKDKGKGKGKDKDQNIYKDIYEDIDKDKGEGSDKKKNETPEVPRISDKGSPSMKPDFPWGNDPCGNDPQIPTTEDFETYKPEEPKDVLKVPPKCKQTEKSNKDDKGRKSCEPCPPPGCQCEICHFLDRKDPEAPFMRDMRRADQRRQLRAYYRQMCHREYIRNRCREEEYRAPRHKCDPICCDNFLCRNPRLAEYCDCLGAVQELQKLLSGAKDNQDYSKPLHCVENLRRRVCQQMCDCILA
uniref:Uncharacterized protein LOC108042276 n=1 Tax=Drosophila rhopaloa TaxID=1041015 RepID=A0A6P4EHE5_DRORH